MERVVLDADWTQDDKEIKSRNVRAADYSERYRIHRRNLSRKVTTFVQRCVFVSFSLFFWAVLLAFLVGLK